MKIVIVTGLAGAGKSTVLRALEDVGFFCIDNLPIPLFQQTLEQLKGVADSVAICIDGRQEMFLDQYESIAAELDRQGHQLEVLYLEASDDVLLRRYSATRRKHPMSGENVRAGIQADRKRLEDLRHSAAAVVNTGALNVHQLKGVIEERYRQSDLGLVISVLSFGFKHGVPPEADLVFDARFLKNPYFDAELSGRDGRDQDVADFVLQTDAGQTFLEKLMEWMEFSLPQFDAEGKKYVTVAIGCTGGRHRSVAIAEWLHKQLSGRWNAGLQHRDLGVPHD